MRNMIKKIVVSCRITKTNIAMIMNVPEYYKLHSQKQRPIPNGS